MSHCSSTMLGWTSLVVLLCTVPAQAQERTLAILPIHAQGIGEETSAMGQQTRCLTALIR